MTTLRMPPFDDEIAKQRTLDLAKRARLAALKAIVLEPAPRAAVQAGELFGRTLEELSPEFREAIVTRELEGFSYTAIATLVGIRGETVRPGTARARKRLRAIVAMYRSLAIAASTTVENEEGESCDA